MDQVTLKLRTLNSLQVLRLHILIRSPTYKFFQNLALVYLRSFFFIPFFFPFEPPPHWLSFSFLNRSWFFLPKSWLYILCSLPTILLKSFPFRSSVTVPEGSPLWFPEARHVFLIICTGAKSLQLCLTLCDSIDGSPPGSPVPGILQARTLEWVAISFSNAGK